MALILQGAPDRMLQMAGFAPEPDLLQIHLELAAFRAPGKMGQGSNPECLMRCLPNPKREYKMRGILIYFGTDVWRAADHRN